MPGWESLIRITPSDSWGTPGTFGKRGFFLFADSENLDYGAQVTERDNKLIGVRESLIDTFSVDRFYPRGGITTQPRADDVLQLLMAHFQCCVKSGTGTYSFFRIPNNLKFTQGGSSYCVGSFAGGSVGTFLSNLNNPFSVNVDVFFGQSFITTGGGQANGIRFTNGIVDKLTISNKYGEDLLMTPEFKFFSGSYYSYPTNFTYPSVYGSLSEYQRMVDYQGTVAVGSEDFDVDGFSVDFSNNTSDKSRLGKRGYNRFPFTGKWTAEGQFDMELSRDLAVLAEGVYTSINIDFTVAAANRLTINQPNIANRAFNVPLNGGDQLIELSKGYRAYPKTSFTTQLVNGYGAAEGTFIPSTIVTVYTGTVFAPAFLGF